MKTLNKEIELLKAARESSGREFEQVETTQKDLEKQLRQKDWELEDMKAMSHARFVDVIILLCSHGLQYVCTRRQLAYYIAFLLLIP